MKSFLQIEVYYPCKHTLSRGSTFSVYIISTNLLSVKKKKNYPRTFFTYIYCHFNDIFKFSCVKVIKQCIMFYVAAINCGRYAPFSSDWELFFSCHKHLKQIWSSYWERALYSLEHIPQVSLKMWFLTKWSGHLNKKCYILNLKKIASSKQSLMNESYTIRQFIENN